MIGDPSGRSTERNLLDRDDARRRTSAAIRGQLERFLDFAPGANGAVLVNNLDWLGQLSLIDFLRDIGKHFTIPYMLAKDSVQVSAGARPVVHRVQLHAPAGVRLRPPVPDDGRRAADGRRRPVGQHHRRPRADPADERRRGGADASADAEPAHGLAYQLLLSPSGAKFGKSEGGDSVWLDPARTSPVRVLPVLAQRRRPRRRHVPALVHRVPARADRGARGRGGGPSRGARGAARARAATSPPGPTGRGGRARRSPIREARVLVRAESTTRRVARVALRVGRRVRRSIAAGWPSGDRASCWPRPGCFASRGEARRMIAGGGGDGQRRTGHATRTARPGADRRGVARRPDRQAPPRDRARSTG